MKNFFLLLSAAFVSWTGVCSATDSPVAKIMSQSQDHDFRGSGVVCLLNGNVYVVTSEHILPPDANSATVLWNGKSLKAQVLASDWSLGLAVLQLTGPLPATGSALALALPENTSPQFSRDEDVEVVGFPFAQMNEPLLSGGQISIVDSQRPFLALTSGVELTDSYAEFGMSGGAVFLKGQSTQTGFIGILSHRIPKIDDGPSSITDLDGSGNARNLFVIPRHTVFEFLQNSTSQKSRFVRRSKIDSPLDVQVGALIFRELPAAPTPPVRFADRGGDGVGVGGEELTHAGRRLQVLIDNGKAGQPWPLTMGGQAAEKWRNLILQRKTVFITALLDPSSGSMKQVPIESLEAFFHSWLKENLQPVIEIPESQSHSQMSPLRADAQHALADYANTATDAAEPLIRDCTNLVNLATPENQSLINRSAFVRVLDVNGPYASGWSSLYAKDFDQALHLMTILTNLSQMIDNR